MFDDWRFENFVKYSKRIPLVQHNVKAGLAVITDPEHDTWSIDGITYTTSELVDIVIKAGWFPCSHTDTHRGFGQYMPTELEEFVKTDVLACNKLGIYSNAIVYPGGTHPAYSYPVLKRSGFCIGVGVVDNKYNCRANSDYDLCRVESGKRVTLAEALAPVV
jgi:hypothetical protein